MGREGMGPTPTQSFPIFQKDFNFTPGFAHRPEKKFSTISESTFSQEKISNNSTVSRFRKNFQQFHRLPFQKKILSTISHSLSSKKKKKNSSIARCPPPAKKKKKNPINFHQFHHGAAQKTLIFINFSQKSINFHQFHNVGRQPPPPKHLIEPGCPSKKRKSVTARTNATKLDPRGLFFRTNKKAPVETGSWLPFIKVTSDSTSFLVGWQGWPLSKPFRRFHKTNGCTSHSPMTAASAPREWRST